MGKNGVISVVERVAHTIKLAYVMVVSSVEGGGPKTRVGTAARGHGELRAEIARFAQIAEIVRLTTQVPTPPGDHHHPCSRGSRGGYPLAALGHPCPKVRIPIVCIDVRNTMENKAGAKFTVLLSPHYE